MADKVPDWAVDDAPDWARGDTATAVSDVPDWAADAPVTKVATPSIASAPAVAPPSTFRGNGADAALPAGDAVAARPQVGTEIPIRNYYGNEEDARIAESMRSPDVVNKVGEDVAGLRARLATPSTRAPLVAPPLVSPGAISPTGQNYGIMRGAKDYQDILIQERAREAFGQRYQAVKGVEAENRGRRLDDIVWKQLGFGRAPDEPGEVLGVQSDPEIGKAMEATDQVRAMAGLPSRFNTDAVIRGQPPTMTEDVRLNLGQEFGRGFTRGVLNVASGVNEARAAFLPGGDPGELQAMAEIQRRATQLPELQPSTRLTGGLFSTAGQNLLVDPNYYAKLLGEQVPQLGVAIAGGGLGKLAGAGVRLGTAGQYAGGFAASGMQQAGQHIERARQELVNRGVPFDEADQAVRLEAAVVGTINGMLDYFSIAKKFGVGPTWGDFAKRQALKAFTEGTTEAMQEAVANIAASVGGHNDKDLNKVIEDILENGFAGLVVGGLIPGGDGKAQPPTTPPVQPRAPHVAPTTFVTDANRQQQLHHTDVPMTPPESAAPVPVEPQAIQPIPLGAVPQPQGTIPLERTNVPETLETTPTLRPALPLVPQPEGVQPYDVGDQGKPVVPDWATVELAGEGPQRPAPYVTQAEQAKEEAAKRERQRGYGEMEAEQRRQQGSPQRQEATRERQELGGSRLNIPSTAARPAPLPLQPRTGVSTAMTPAQVIERIPLAERTPARIQSELERMGLTAPQSAVNPPPIREESASAPQLAPKPVAQPLSYEQFAKQYRDAFAGMNKYAAKPGRQETVGVQHYTEKMAKLADENPAHLERFEAEEEAAAAQVTPTAPPDPSPREAQAAETTAAAPESVEPETAPSTQMTMAGEAEGRTTVGDTGRLFAAPEGKAPLAKSEKVEQPTLPKNAAKFGVTINDINRAQVYGANPSAAFAAGVKHFLENSGAKLPPMAGMTKYERVDRQAGWNAVSENAPPAVREEIESKAEGDKETGKLNFAAPSEVVQSKVESESKKSEPSEQELRNDTRKQLEAELKTAEARNAANISDLRESKARKYPQETIAHRQKIVDRETKHIANIHEELRKIEEADKKETPNASTVPSDQGQPQSTGEVGQGSEARSSGDVQQAPSEQPDVTGPPARQKEETQRGSGKDVRTEKSLLSRIDDFANKHLKQGQIDPNDKSLKSMPIDKAFHTAVGLIAKGVVKGIRATQQMYRFVRELIKSGGYSDADGRAIIGEARKIIDRSVIADRLDLRKFDDESGRRQDEIEAMGATVEKAEIKALERGEREGKQEARGEAQKKITEIREEFRQKSKEDKAKAKADATARLKEARAKLKAKESLKQAYREETAKILAHVLPNNVAGNRLLLGLVRADTSARQKLILDRAAMMVSEAEYGNAGESLIDTVGGVEKDTVKNRILRREIDREAGIRRPKPPIAKGEIKPEEMGAKYYDADYLKPEKPGLEPMRAPAVMTPREAVTPLIESIRKREGEVGPDGAPTKGGIRGTSRLANFIRHEQENGMTPEFSKEELVALSKLDKPVSQLDAEESALVERALRYAKHLDNEFKSGVGKQNFARVKERSENINESLAKTFSPLKTKRGDTPAERNRIKRALFDSRLDGWNRWGTLGDAGHEIVEELWEGENKARAIENTFHERESAVFKKYGVTESSLPKMLNKRAVEMDVQGAGGAVQKRQFTVANLVEAAYQMLSPKNAHEHLERSGSVMSATQNDAATNFKMTEPILRDAIERAEKSGAAPKGFIDAYAKMRFEWGNTIGKEHGNETSQSLSGSDVFTVPDYATIKRAWGQSKESTPSEVADLASRGNFYGAQLTGIGILQNRVESTLPLVIGNGILSARDHARNLAYYSGLAKPIHDALRVLKNSKSEIVRHLGNKYYMSLLRNLQHGAGLAGEVRGDLLTNILRRGLSGIAVNALGANPGPALVQLSFPYLVAMSGEVNAVDAAKLSGAPVTVKPDPAIEKNDYLRERWSRDHMFRTMTNSASWDRHMPTNVVTKTMQTIADVSMIPMAMAEKSTATRIFHVLRDSSDNPGTTAESKEAWALKQTERFLRRMNNPSSLFDASDLTLKARESVLYSFLSFMQGQRDKMQGLWMGPMMRGEYGKSTAMMARLAPVAVVSSLLRWAGRGVKAAALYGLANLIWGGSKDEDDDEKVHSTVKDAIGEYGDMFMPEGGSLLRIGLAALSGDDARKEMERATKLPLLAEGSKLVTNIGALIKDYQQATDANLKNDRWVQPRKAALRIATSVASVLGVPAGWLINGLVYEATQDKKKEPSPFKQFEQPKTQQFKQFAR